MSDDLISRKAALEIIRNIAYSMELSTFECKLYGNIYDGIKNMPTAFDKEKAIDKLEDYLFEKYCVEGDEKIAEIVEKGGIE